MRRIRYQVAASLDGYIAGPQGQYDWIPTDPEIDFDSIFAQFDTLLMGRKTYEQLQASGDLDAFAHMRTIVFSRTLNSAQCPGATLVAGEDWSDAIEGMRGEPGKDIWLFGGGQLFQACAHPGL